MTAQVSEEEILQTAKKLQEEFIGKFSDSEHVDPRDLSRAQRELGFVAKYVRQQRGNYDNAFNQMVESLKWRKRFGVNDIHFDDIDDNLWRIGMAYNHGMDKLGNHIVVLNIRLHRRDSKKSLALQQWVTFCFETHTRVFPNDRMCLIFDMNGCGLSQMDMELMRFIVNCFKIYFPDILGLLLVYNMPWILQAAWKIVQTWLSEGAIAKIKFVNSDTIREYISPDQLLVCFGGEDTWEYDYDREVARYLEQIQQGWKEEEEEGEGEGEATEFRSIRSNEVHSSDLEQSPTGGSQESGGGEVGAEEGRKVRFSANLPPTRQSRFGPEEEQYRVGEDESHSPNSLQLLRGSAASHGFRRRQVHKLMSLQSDPRVQRSPDTPNSILRRHSEPSPAHSTPFTDIVLSPLHELLFAGQRNTDLLCTLSLSNTSDHTVAFKIKTTAPRRYKVRPNLALIDSKSTTTVQVLLMSGSTDDSISGDKFLIQVYSLPPSTSVLTQSELLSFWRALPESNIEEHRMRCRWIKDSGPTQSSPSSTPNHLHHTPTPSQTPPTDRKEAAGDKGVGVTVGVVSPETQRQRELRSIGNKLETLVTANQQLARKVQWLQRWNFVALLLLLLILVATYLHL